jgi:protein-S-isoprenylcysteine O-methyltransferase Ste14
MKSPRLQEQGFVNLHRKFLFILMSLGLAAYLFYAPDPWKLSNVAMISLQIAGTLMVFIGILGRVLATLSIGGLKDRTIMTTELYSVCRNPLYFASFLMASGVGALSGRLDFLLLTSLCFLAIFYPMMLNEAKYLRNKFADFADYEDRVPLFFPNFSLWEERKNFEINFKRVKRTLLDASLVLPIIPIMILVRTWITSR